MRPADEARTSGVTTVMFDENQDGWFEQMEFRGPDGRATTTWLDRDADGLYEEARTSGEMRAYDRDADGLAEVVECESGSGVRVTFDANACALTSDAR